MCFIGVLKINSFPEIIIIFLDYLSYIRGSSSFFQERTEEKIVKQSEIITFILELLFITRNNAQVIIVSAFHKIIRDN